MVVDADETGDREERLAGHHPADVPANLPDGIPAEILADRPGGERGTPAIGVKCDVAVEAARGASVGRELRGRVDRIGACEVYAVVPEEDTVAVRLVTDTDQIRGPDHSEIDAPTEARESSGQPTSDRARDGGRHTDGEEIDIG